MDKNLETTFYRFYSEIRSFLSELISDPIKAEPTKYLKDREFGKSKIIRVLMDKGVLERHESIKDQTNSDEYKKPTYVVKYKVRRKDFETKIHRIYSKYFEKNLPEKKKTEGEIDEATACGASSGQYSAPMFPLMRREINEDSLSVKPVFANEDEEIRKLESIDHAYCERGGTKAFKPKKRVYITERQFRLIQEMINDINAGDVDLDEATTTQNVGSMGNYTANGLVLKTSDGKTDPSYKR